MTDFKQVTYQIESEFLSPYAVNSANTKGRLKDIQPCCMRTEFQRDRDRILHCKAFRRLKHKTQVFLSPEGDHYRTRLTHTLEVAQIARSIARALRMNEDLCEAIALGHDLGHTPYGHAGERALNTFTHFRHNEQSLRVVEKLEYDGKGMNLCYEVRDGILNHPSDCTPNTLEGVIVSLSDKIAYINHDIDDAVHGGIISETDIPDVYRKNVGESHGKRINNMILDIINHSYGKDFVAPSVEFKGYMDGLRSFMFDKVYVNSKAKAEEGKAVDMIKFLYEYYYRNKDKLPKLILDMDSELPQKVCDHISGMSDRYAVKVYEDITIPKSWGL